MQALIYLLSLYISLYFIEFYINGILYYAFILFSMSIIILRSIRLSSSVQFGCSVMSNSLQPHGLQHARPAIINSRSLLKLMSIKSVMPSNRLILCHPLILLPSIFPQDQGLFQWVILHIWWSKYWSFSFNISPSNEYSGLISFGIDWFDFLAPRDSQESFPTPQFKSINSSVLSFLYSPTLTPIHDYWKNHSFD